MSDGKTHHLIWKRNWRWVPLLSLASLWIGNFLIAVCVPLGYFLGRYLDPDLDQPTVTSSEGRMINELPVFGYLLFGYWSIYGGVLRRKHRSFWTHFPGVSTLCRMVYQFWWIFPIIYINNWFYGWIFQIFLGIWIGLSYADFLHWIEDIRSKEVRISFRRKR